ncbi:hypothetical protein L0664_06890 [Octadecabacter sp. G9-8]|uniref:Deacetylase sirtuin-type domain-containing protein n=1 Tax=Octadecabacter dasysiphoniae TaxID=2909341 RepID=A0ABS9CU65_9RHOB|nr:hypothetical protein [Octadecabacter dasysiphoniae]MCF2870788.1 hypothetical protein [Octadecabacter dasysiphoniae]
MDSFSMTAKRPFEAEHVLIVGAGASFNAGLPLASDFTDRLTDTKRLSLDGPSVAQVRYIKTFVKRVFAEDIDIDAGSWPEIEDIFTLIDLSANTGHHLGKDYAPRDLRVVRRAILVRLIRMFEQSARKKRRNPDAKWSNLEDLFSRFCFEECAVLSMNWDTVFEEGLLRTQGVESIEYGCNALSAKFCKDSLKETKRSGDTLHIVKPHGSVNWLYCDNCRATFWVGGESSSKIARALFQPADWDAIGVGPRGKRHVCIQPKCPYCSAKSLGTRFATFSYKKALDFPMFTASWTTAEKRLAEATNWIFFGYSLPAADFEFKAMLKRIQLTENIRPKITVITGGDDAESTITRYKNFFGHKARERSYFKDGLDCGALAHLETLGVLQGGW